jgi:hypothetical protein
MSGEARTSARAQLALAIAHGVPINTWARANEVPAQTAYRRARDPKVRRVVETFRRRTIDEAIGRMTQHSTFAVDGIVTVARKPSRTRSG